MRVRGEVADRAEAPMDVLQAALRIVGHVDAEVRLVRVRVGVRVRIRLGLGLG